MVESPSEGRDRRSERWAIGLVFVVAAAIRLGFVLTFPTIHGGDASARLAHPTTFVLGYQLPLPQAFVVLGKGVSDDPTLTRLIFCVWGGILAAGIAALAFQLAGIRAAAFAGLLASADPLLIHYSIVPYQEPIAYGLLAWAFILAYRGRVAWASLFLGAACMCRYEAWLFLPFFWALTRSAWTGAAALPAAGWMLWWRGLAPSGLYVLDIDATASRLPRLEYLGGKLIEYESKAALVLIACCAVTLAVRAPKRLSWIAGAIMLIFGVIVTLGHEFPVGSGRMSERLIHLPVLLGLLVLGVGLARLGEYSRVRLGLALSALTLLFVRDIRFERALLRAAALEPDLALARDTARAIEAARKPAECVSVAAPTVDPALIDAYIGKVESAFGDVARARERGTAAIDVSPDRDRIAANLKAPAGTVRAHPGCALFVSVDQADESVPDQKAIPLTSISAGPRRAQLYRIPD